jgi:hypothetical protein
MLNLTTSKPNDFMGAVGAAFNGVSNLASAALRTPLARSVMLGLAASALAGAASATTSPDLQRVARVSLDTMSAAPVNSQFAANTFAGPSRKDGPSSITVSRYTPS